MMKKIEEERSFHGIVVFYKIYNEQQALIGVLTDESCYIKGYVKHANYTPGQQVLGKINSITGYTKFFIDSIENSMGMLFWNDHAKLFELMHVLNSIDTLPENIVFPGLYERFLAVIAQISIAQANLKKWDEYILNI